MKQETITSQEIELIAQYASTCDDPNLMSEKLQQLIKAELGFNRSVQQIKNQLIAIQKMTEHERALYYESRRKQQGGNLFKTFEQENRNNDNPSINFIRPVPRRKNSVSFHSRRKIVKKQRDQHINCSLQQRLNQLEAINEQCTYNIQKLDRKLNRKASFKEQSGISANVLWFYHEFFYSNYDGKYFQAAPMKEIYAELGIKGGVKLKNHKRILHALPKPKLFNEKHILNQKSKLEQFRNQCRQNTKNLSKNNQAGTEFPVHSIVLALHPMCGHLHTGSIMAYYKQNLYMVRFLKPELPAHKILDINMSTEFTNIPNKTNRTEEGADKDKGYHAANQNAQGNVVDNINFEVTAYLLKILQFKADVVKLMISLNDKDDKKQNVAPERGEQTRISIQVFQWAVKTIGIVDFMIQQMLVRFRLRGVNQANSQSIFGNLKNLLLNPLKLMSKQFENSNEQSDVNATQQIKQIINKQRDSQIKKAISSAISAANGNAKDPKQRKAVQMKIMPLLYSCLGILADLKHEGKDFDVQSNPHLMKLADLSGKENSEIFNQVYQRLFSIVTKFKQ